MKTLALFMLLGSVAVGATGCYGPSDPECASGTGTLAIENTTPEAIQISLEDETGGLTDLSVASASDHDEVVPTGAYTVVATGATSGRTLLQQSYAVRCDADTAVVVEPLVQFALAVSVSGDGKVTSVPAGIDCDTSSCSASFDIDTQVTLSAASGSGSRFVGWTGDCTGSGSCSVTLNRSRSVGAQFVPISDEFSVTLTGNGQGSLSSEPQGIACSNVTGSPSDACSTNFDRNTDVMLTATPGVGSKIGKGNVNCDWITNTCAIRVSGASNVAVEFELIQETLSVAKIGNGTGVVTSSAGAINCGSSCAADYDYGTMLTLTAVAQMGSEFAGWSGACSGTGACVVTMTEARSVTAQFNLIDYTLSVTMTGTGGGLVSSTPAGINCGATCSALYDFGTVVNVYATPLVGSRFAGWSGACSGTGACVVTVNQATTVFANFEQILLTAPLVVNVDLGQKSQGQIQAQGMNYYIATQGVFPSQSSANNSGTPFLGQIMLFAGGFAPGGWRLCDGALLPINQNQALFSLLGTMYGGNGTTHFALPDLRARAPMGMGTLSGGGSPPPSPGTSVVPMISTIGWGGVAQGQVHALGVNFLIATQGEFPPRDGSSPTTTNNYYGQIMMFAGNFAPAGWRFCDGTLLPINTNTALFSLLGTTYGGNGITQFALPDLRSRIPVGRGSLTSPTIPPVSATQIPLITSIEQGQALDGQAGVLGIHFSIAYNGIYPPMSGSITSSGTYIGQILMFAGNFAPSGWSELDGGSMSIGEYDTLFSLIGTVYGGNGTTHFSRPDLRARAAMGPGSR